MALHPGLIVRVNKQVVAAISSEGLNIISARIWADIHSLEVAKLDVTGGFYSGDASTHLTWVSDHEITEQDQVEFAFSELSGNSHPGKSFEECFPNADEGNRARPISLSEIAEDLRQESAVRNGFNVHVITGSDSAVTYEVRPSNYYVLASAMWDWKSLTSAKFGVTSATIDSVISRDPGVTFVRERIKLGERVRVQVAVA